MPDVAAAEQIPSGLAEAEGALVRRMRFVVATLLVVAPALYLGRIWLSTDEAWLHPELLGTSAYIWINPDGESLTDRARKVFDWRAFDPNVNRVRPLNDAAEVVDAIARPYLSNLFGPHPSITPIALLTCISSPLLLYFYFQKVRPSHLNAAAMTAILVSSVGFLSVHVAYIRPAKKLTILLLCAALCLAAAFERSRSRRSFLALWISLFTGCFADEMALANYVAVGLLHAPALLVTTSWKRRLAFLFLPVSFLATVKWILPAIYVTWSVHGEWNALADSKKLAILEYLAYPEFYTASLTHTARSVLSTVGIHVHNSVTEGLVLLCILLFPAAALLSRRLRTQHGADCYRLAAASTCLLAAGTYATLLDWYPFPFEVSYLGSFNYYYHSSMVVLVVVWLASILNVATVAFAPVRARKPRLQTATTLTAAAFCGAVVVCNFSLFHRVNRLVQIIHTYPYAAEDLQAEVVRGGAVARQDRDGSREVIFYQQRDQLDAEFKQEAAVLFGDEWRQSKFYQLFSVFRETPITQDHHLSGLLHAHYPNRAFTVRIAEGHRDADDTSQR